MTIAKHLQRRSGWTIGGALMLGLNRTALEQLRVNRVLILRVIPGSTAPRLVCEECSSPRTGAWAPGDIIVAIDDRPVESVARLLSRLDDHQVGDGVRLTIRRDGHKVEGDRNTFGGA